MSARTCPSCGTPVTASERFCASCGARLPAPDAAVGPTVALPRPDERPTVAIPPARPEPPPDFGAPPGATPPPKPFPWLAVLLAAAGLCVISSVAVFAGLLIIGSSTQGAATAVAVERPAPTRAATAAPRPTGGASAAVGARQTDAALRSTAQAEAQSAVESVRASATALAGEASARQAEATAQAATAEALAIELAATAEAQALLAAAKQVFRDEFVDNRNNWFTGRFNDKETDLIEDGVFKVQWDAEGTSFEVYEVRDMTSFIAEVDCAVVKGGEDGSCGLIFAQQVDVGFYKYEVFNNYYRLFLVRTGQDPQMLAEGDPAGIIKPDNTNRLRVVRSGGEIRLFLNDQLLDASGDTTFASGKVGVSTDSYSKTGGVEIWFDNFTVWELPG